MKFDLTEFNFQKQVILGLHQPLIKTKLIVGSFFSLLGYLRNPKIFFRIIQMLILQIGTKKKIINKFRFIYGKDGIDVLLNSGKSLIRFGDGDILLTLNHKTKGFNPDHYKANQNTVINDYLLRIINEFDEKAPFYIAISSTILLMSDFESISSGLFSLHYPQRYFFLKYLNSKKVPFFIDALIFRPESSTSNEDISKLWNNKNVIIIHSKIEVINSFKLRHTSGITKFVSISSNKAHLYIDEILDEVNGILNNNKNYSWTVLVSAGVAAKPIVYKLALQNIVSYDMGNYFELKF